MQSGGKYHLVFKEIIDHQHDDMVVPKENGFVEGYNGNRHRVKTMKGWDICVE